MYKVFLYPSDVLYQFFDFSNLTEFLKQNLKTEINTNSLITDINERFVEKILNSKIINPFVKQQPNYFFEKEKEFELDFLKNKKNNTQIYDGFILQEIYREFLKCKLKECHIIFTQRIIATFDDTDGRYHNRVVILGYPCLISLAGFSKALVLPKEYYFLKTTSTIFKEDIKKNVYELIDKNLNFFIFKYILQCLFYVFFNEFDCKDKKCLIADNHWFEEVYTQVVNKTICLYHKEYIKLIGILK